MPEDTDTDIAAELDALHAEGRRAYRDRDVASYRRIFSEDLKYTQHDGKTIGLDRLMSDVREQFSRVTDVGGRYERESIEIHGPDHVTETLTQTAWAEMRVFLFFKRRWFVWIAPQKWYHML